MNRQSQKITVLYCRLAHYNNDFDTHNGWRQREILLQYAISHSLENPCFYCDWGFSGITLNRPEFNSMLREIERGNVANLVVQDLSRLMRDSFRGWEFIDVTLPEHGVRLYSIRDGIIPQTAPLLPQYRQIMPALYKSVRGGRA